MKTILSSIFFLCTLFSFSQVSITGNWTTNPNFPNAKIIVGNLDGSYLFNVNSTSVNNPDKEVLVYREGKSTVKLTEGSNAIMSCNTTTRINYNNNDTLPVSGKWMIFDLEKNVKGIPAQWNIGSIGNKTSTTVLDADVEFFFTLNIGQNTGCNNAVLNVKIDNTLITIDGTTNAFPFIQGNTFVGYGKKVEVSLVSGTCPNLKMVNGSITIYE